MYIGIAVFCDRVVSSCRQMYQDIKHKRVAALRAATLLCMIGDRVVSKEK